MSASIQLGKNLSAEREPNSFYVDPTNLKLGVNSRQLDGDTLTAEERNEDQNRAINIATFGQKVPAIAYRSGKDTVLTAGFGRYRSILLLREGFEVKGERYHDPKAQLLIRVDESIKDEKGAFLASVLENVRKEVNPYAVALAQRKLQDEYGYSLTEIAKLYGYDNTNAVSRSFKLLEADQSLQTAVRKGQVALSVALEIAKLPEELQKDQVAKVKEGQKLQIKDIIEAKAGYLDANGSKEVDPTDPQPQQPKAERAKSDQPKNPAGDVKPTKRNSSAVIAWAKAHVEDSISDPLPDVVASLLDGLVKFCEGSATERTLDSRLSKLIAALK